MKFPQLIACVALGFASLLQATTIIEHAGPVDSLATDTFYGVSWTQTQTYVNVSVGAVLGTRPNSVLGNPFIFLPIR